jgi:hypothetical protein
MRSHIAKSLQSRCKAIQNAVKTYNAAALALDPPRPTVDWSKVSHYNFLEEFNLLRDTRQDIQNKPWARPAVRETMKKATRIKCANEEIENCNTEVRRLHTSIVDENQHMELRLQDLRIQQDPICGAVEEYVVYRRRVNAQIMSRIHQIHDLKGFTGNNTPGVRKGGRPVVANGTPARGDMDGQEGHALLNDDQDETLPEPGGDDDVTDTINSLVDYVSHLSM